MPATLFEAPEYDAARERRRRTIITIVVFAVLMTAFVGWRFRHWPEERAVSRFFAALQQQQFETAYGIWLADPAWQQHPQQYSRYPFDDFYRDWGPGGDWGLIKSYSIDGTAVPPAPASGVVVVVTVNHRVEKARIWVQTGNKRLTFSPM